MSSPLVSPSSDQQFWSTLRGRVETLLEHQNRVDPMEKKGARDSGLGKRLREDSVLLIKGFDSIASSLSRLTNTLDSAAQGVNDLARPSVTELLRRENQTEDSEENQSKAKKQCSSPQELAEDKDKDGEKQGDGAQAGNGKLKKAQKLAVSLAIKATSLAQELKSRKSELCFVQERCVLLEEENKMLRDGIDTGLRPEEDDLVRLQLEALLAEKSRLANENAGLIRENHCLRQLVEYHQLASQDLSESYEDAVFGTCLDFSSPSVGGGTGSDDCNNESSNIDASGTPRPPICSLQSLEEGYEKEEQ
ncbi:hypothetical protein QJS04_geneDACA009656 [Acorus gramineus]|uniref:Uncharacterized protein n=1 Tax=Acorus gramineus TaxID=55184 RepID=A0AAV9B9S2_ACOGR|nr:hypothetical protein QJS04_geneDACA009656 [Acorus gramineus]